MTILHRYVTKEILACFAIILVVVISIYMAIDFIEKVDNFLESGVPASRCVVYLLYKLPLIIVQILPVGFLLSILVALGLMSKNNEVIALKSCGIGKSLLLKPTLLLGALFCGGLFAIAEWGVPDLMVKANQIWLQEVRKKNITATRTNDIWLRTARQIVHIKQYTPEANRVAGITIYGFDDAFRLIERVDALTGRFDDGRWRLDDVIHQVFAAADGPDQYNAVDRLTVDIDLNPDDLARAVKRSEEMGLAELGRTIAKVEKEGYGATRYRVDYHGKIAAPFVCIFLSVLGAAIALRGKLRQGMPVSIIYGLAIAFAYWIFNSFCLSLGYAEMMPPVVAAWVANVVFACISVFLLLNAP